VFLCWSVSRTTVLHPPQLLVLAEPLRAAGLAHWLESDQAFQVRTALEDLQGSPHLVIWALGDVPPTPDQLTFEALALRERWQPAPILLIVPSPSAFPRDLLLALPVEGVLDRFVPEAIHAAVATLLGGGRVMDLSVASFEGQSSPGPVMGLGEWLLTSGLSQIDAELRFCQRLLEPPQDSLLALLLLQGRVRELRAARSLLLWIWGPASMAWSQAVPSNDPSELEPRSITSLAPLTINLRQRSADGIWDALLERLRDSSLEPPANHTGQLLALDGLHPDRRRDLLMALLEQFSQLRCRLRDEADDADDLPSRWLRLQPELRRQALRSMAGSYVQLPYGEELRPVAESLVLGSDLELSDPEIPDPRPMLATLTEARPVLVEGQLLAPDEPRALLYLELLLANWMVRTAELISAEVLAACAEWPELRRYLLRPDLLPTRNLERLRNQLNAQQRWDSWFARPIQLYESRRPLYCLEAGTLRRVDLTEPRDAELRRMGWLQQLVTLALEARDALAPQLQGLIRGLGDLVVVFLTQVVGRAIGLVARGILQGMGKGLGRG
jgi:hypothetical protein